MPTRRPFRFVASTVALAVVANLAACGGERAMGGGGYYPTTAAPPPPPGNAGSPSMAYAPSPVVAGEAAPGMAVSEKSVAYDGSSTTGATVPMALPPAPPPMSPTSTSPASTTITTTTTITIGNNNTNVIPPPAYPDDPGSPTGGLLTAAIWDDNAIRGAFETFLARYPSFKENWPIDLSHRVIIRVEDSKGVLVGDAPVALRAPDGEVIQLRTHADGTTVFFPTAKMLQSSVAKNQQQQGQQQQNGFNAAAQVGTLRTETNFAIPSAGDNSWTIKLAGIPGRATLPAVDVAFVVDTTGSMGDEISYLQNELVGVVQRVKKEQSMRRVRLALVLYKDRGDEYVTKTFPFTEDLSTFLGELKQAGAGGGGDMPESVNAALHDTIEDLAWAGDESARLAFLVADAPPHYYADETYTYKDAAWDLSARGIKFVPVAASGIDKSTEYVFRELAAFTGGRYVFLTDDSGIGDSHLVPDITGYQVEHLDRILVRAIRDEAAAFKR